MENKINKISEILDKRSVFYVSNPSDIFYLTCFSGTFAKILITKEKVYFITDKRYEGEIKDLHLPFYFDVLITKDFKKDLKLIIKGKNKIFMSKKTALKDYLIFKNKKVNFNERIMELRMIKTKEEIENIKNAVKITEKGIKYIAKFLKKGITEKEIAIEFEYFIKKNGADGLSFEPIIAFDKNSAVPHHKTGAEKLKENSIVLVDVGVKYRGYCSDLTRVICFNIIKSRLGRIKKYHDILINTRDFCFKFMMHGISCSKTDKKAREYLKKYKIDKLFLHSLGHGIGVDIHEPPFLNKNEKIKFKKGMVVTCEPGVYFKEDFGLRIEDDYLITDNLPEKISEIDENLIII